MTYKESKTFTDKTNDTLFVQVQSDNELLMRATQSGRGQCTVRFSEADSIRVRDYLLELYPLKKEEKPSIVTDFSSLEDRVMALLTSGGMNVTININNQ